MGELSLLVTISDRKFSQKFLDFYSEKNLPVALVTVGRGTASSEILDYFGLQGDEKTVLFHFVTASYWKELKKALRMEMHIDLPGIGIAFLVPLSSIGGKKALSYLTMGQQFTKGEESTLKETKFELVVVIANQGHSEMIMDAAREAHAGGGTVLHARGTGTEKAEQFLGITLVPEKEMVFIVVRSSQKNDVMNAIMQKAGLGTKAGAIAFSLPVTATAGIRMMEEDLDDLL